MDWKPIPNHETAVKVRYEDVWNGDLFCPFCGMKSVAFVVDEWEAMPCPHILCASAHGAVLLVSDVFMENLQELDRSITYEQACDRGYFPWPDAEGQLHNVSTDSFCSIVPNSITIICSDSETGEDLIVSYAPIPVPRAERLNLRTRMHP